MTDLENLPALRASGLRLGGMAQRLRMSASEQRCCTAATVSVCGHSEKQPSCVSQGIRNSAAIPARNIAAIPAGPLCALALAQCGVARVRSAHVSLFAGSTTMKNAGILLLFVSASGLLLTACASQTPMQQVVPAPAAGTVAPAITAPAATAAASPTTNTSKPTNGAPAVTVAGTRYGNTRRVTKDGVEYFCERPAPTGSRFIAPGEQCYTEAQLRAVRERDQDFVHRQQSLGLQTNTTGVMRTAISP
jgi:hypothetical protein